MSRPRGPSGALVDFQPTNGANVTGPVVPTPANADFHIIVNDTAGGTKDTIVATYRDGGQITHRNLQPGQTLLGPFQSIDDGTTCEDMIVRFSGAVTFAAPV